MTNEELVNEYQAGNIGVLDEICNQNKKLLFKIVNEFRYIYAGESIARATVTESSDLMQIGYIGLMSAVKNYDPRKEASFSTVAVMYIRAAIIRELSNTGNSVRLPEYRKKELKRLRTAINYLMSEHGRKPTRGEISAFLGVSVESIDELTKYAIQRKITSLDKPIGEQAEGETLIDLIPDNVNPYEEIENSIQNEQLKITLWGIIDELDAQQSTVLHKYYEDEKTIDQVSREMNLSEQRVATLKNSAIHSLRHNKNRRILYSFYGDYEKASCIAYHAGAGSFKSTGSSATERAALLRIEAEEQTKMRARTEKIFDNAGLSESQRKQFYRMYCKRMSEIAEKS